MYFMIFSDPQLSIHYSCSTILSFFSMPTAIKLLADLGALYVHDLDNWQSLLPAFIRKVFSITFMIVSVWGCSETGNKSGLPLKHIYIEPTVIKGLYSRTLRTQRIYPMHQHTRTQIYSIYLYLKTPEEAELLFPKGSRFHKRGQQQQEKKTHSTCVLN